ncbi:MAG: magnesium transporter [Candidatus Hodarchaeota archaeon]
MVMANGPSRGRSLVWRVYREAMPILLFTVVAELFAGYLLIQLEHGSLANLVGLFVLIPGLMQLRGNISTALAQRLGSATHLGTISWKQGLNEPLRANIKVAFYLGLVMSFSLGVGAWVVTQLSLSSLGNQGISIDFHILALSQFVTIAMVTALLASLVQVTITVTVALFAHAKGLDPDNVVIPMVAAIGDIITIACLLFAINFAVLIVPPWPL